MNIRFVIQARLSSKRLPGKVLADINGLALIEHILSRLEQITTVNFTTTFALAKESTNKLQNFLRQKTIHFIEGSDSDVMSRFIEAGKDLNDHDYIVRLTADNPFLDYECANNLLQELHNNRADLIYPWKLPLGMAFEVIRVGALRSQSQHSLSPHHLEHVSTFIKENRDKYNVQKITYYDNDSNVRLTIDEPADLEQARKTYSHFLTRDKPYFTSKDVYELHSKDPDFFNSNKEVVQRPPTSYDKKSFK